ncbi:MAG TPA: TetR/AcrR family transcriptional regulator [Terriglobales bacterium]|nr:TetR/AcrR family transcriptional regulator [Terriglobales bacterium]
MTIADRRERDKQMRRDCIVEAAERLFFSKGFAATTMDEVAEAAELSKGTIYLYYKNKEEIYVAIVHRGMQILIDLFREAVGSASTGMGKVKALGQALFTFYERHPRHFTAVFYHHESPSAGPLEMDLDDPVVKDLVRDGEELYAFSADAIEGGIKDGTIRPGVDPIKTTYVLSSMILGLIRTVAVEEKFLQRKFNVTVKDLIQEAFGLIEHSLRAHR